MQLLQLQILRILLSIITKEAGIKKDFDQKRFSSPASKQWLILKICTYISVLLELTNDFAC